MSLGKITDCSNPETFLCDRNCFEARGKYALFEGIGKDWVWVWVCVRVCLGEGSSGNIFVNTFLELKYPIVIPHYLEISVYKTRPLGQFFICLIQSSVTACLLL